MSEKVITATRLMMEHANSPEEVMKYWDSVLKERDELREQVKEFRTVLEIISDEYRFDSQELAWKALGRE